MDNEINNVTGIEEARGKREFIKRAKSKDNFTIINTACLQDYELSMDALGMLSYLMSLPSDWEISVTQLSERFKCNKDKVYSVMNKLIKANYMKKYQERDKNGKILDWITEVSDNPNILKSDKKINILPLLEKPDLVKSRSGKTDTTKYLVNNKELKNNTTQDRSLKSEPEVEPKEKEVNLLSNSDDVVVSLMNKLEPMFVPLDLAKDWIKRYGTEYVMEKVDYTLSSSRKNPGAFLNCAIKKDWKKPLGKPLPMSQKPPSEILWPSNDENRTWFSSLSSEEKEKFYNEASNKHQYFCYMVKKESQKKGLDDLSFLEQGFINNSLFRMMMSIIGRAK